MIGNYVVVRATGAGVHAGTLKSYEGQSCVLTDARRIWRYRVPMGASEFLSGVATAGLDHSDSKVGAPVSEIILTENCEIIATTPMAAASIQEAPVWTRTR
ncbi:hypothetical protein [uncultured Paracoccus sp.]|uniref:DUF6948 domain-containing protein n=1 Tax=uncultured Paracoccus sp. TaxID=189685 RepID=UPI002618BB64|nr:hypothetical protein [uncultured Paracoccus sp.]